MRVRQMAITGLLVGAARALIPRTTFGANKRGLARRRAARKQQQAQRMPAPAPETPAKVEGHARRLSQLQGHTCLVLNADWQPLSYLPLSVWSWQDAVKAAWQERVHVVSSYDVRVRSASASFAIPSVVVLRNYEKRGAEKLAETEDERARRSTDQDRGDTCTYTYTYSCFYCTNTNK